MALRTSQAREAQEGFVLITVAALLVVLIGFVTLGVSTGYLYSARTTAQSIGDAAAIAGAYTYITTPGDPNPGATAEYHAEQFALGRANILGIPLTPADVDAVADVVNRRVEVTIRTTQPTFFGRVIGMATGDIRTVSTAEAGAWADSESCAKPFFIPNNVFWNGSEFCPSCDAGDNGQGLLVHRNGDGEFVKSDWVDAVVNDPNDSLFTLKPTNPGQGGEALSPGQYFLIDFDTSQDNDLYDNIRGCDTAATRVECFGWHSVQTGVEGGVVRGGLYGRGNESGLLPDPPDRYEWGTSPPIATGASSYSQKSNSSPQLVAAPIWDVCGYEDQGLCTTGNFDGQQGTGLELMIVGFAQVFITDPTAQGWGGGQGGQGDVDAYLVNVTGCGEQPSGDDDNGAPSGSTVLSLPLRLIQNDAN